MLEETKSQVDNVFVAAEAIRALRVTDVPQLQKALAKYGIYAEIRFSMIGPGMYGAPV